MHQIQLPLACKVATTKQLLSHALYPTQSLVTFLTTSATTSNKPTFLRGNNTTLSYSNIPCSTKAQAGNQRLQIVKTWLNDLQQPFNMSNSDYATFVWYATSFFLLDHKLWQ